MVIFLAWYLSEVFFHIMYEQLVVIKPLKTTKDKKKSTQTKNTFGCVLVFDEARKMSINNTLTYHAIKFQMTSMQFNPVFVCYLITAHFSKRKISISMHVWMFLARIHLVLIGSEHWTDVLMWFHSFSLFVVLFGHHGHDAFQYSNGKSIMPLHNNYWHKIEVCNFSWFDFIEQSCTVHV